MRLPILALVATGALATAGGAAAQVFDGVAVSAETPTAQSSYLSPSFGGPARDNSDRSQRYLIRLHSLQEWLLKLKAQDGGQLSDEHAAVVQRRLDKLNRIYGKG